jgi:hypothetical protein
VFEREIDAAAPNVGDRIVIARGSNYATAYDGDEGPKGRSFGVACEPSGEPLPDGDQGELDDDGIPF